jgi:hypothetical protein
MVGLMQGGLDIGAGGAVYHAVVPDQLSFLEQPRKAEAGSFGSANTALRGSSQLHKMPAPKRSTVAGSKCR